MDQRPAASRNSFLDLVRGIAIVRVTIWHTFGYAWISYLVASMPAMFFVAGSLMARSLERQSAREVLTNRFRRLLIPLWPFAAVALSVMLGYAAWHSEPAAQVSLTDLWRWVFPIWDPEGSQWGLSWWAALWYVRCLVWLLLLSPVLWWTFKRTRGAATLVPLAAIAALEWATHAGTPLPWQFSDLALYSFFWMLGFGYHVGWATKLNTASRLRLCGAAVLAALAWLVAVDVPGHVVNASYPLHLFVGLAWLFGALAIENGLGQFAVRPRIAAILYFVNERALTIYLWHNAGLFVMYHLLWTREQPDWLRYTAALPLVIAVTGAGIVLFGWVEDIAARRSPRLWPVRPPARGEPVVKHRDARPVLPRFAAGVVVVVGAVAIGLSATAITQDRTEASARQTALAAPPSGVGLRLRTERINLLEAQPTPNRAITATGPVTVIELQAILDRWREDYGLSGALVGIADESGVRWEGASGTDAAGEPLLPDRIFPIASMTKTFTVAVVLQLAQEQELSLDDPVSLHVPDFPGASEFTVRQLIQHTSGLISTDGIEPFYALQLAAESGLQNNPGVEFVYSTPGYFLLALIIEETTGTPYTQAVRERLLAPLQLEATFMDEELEPLGRSTHPYRAIYEYEFEGFTWSSGGLHLDLVPEFTYEGILWSSAGLRSTTSDLSRWAVSLWGTDKVVTPQTLDEMTTFLGPEFEYTGLGTYPYCPCWQQGGRILGERWGHLGATGQLEYDPNLRLGIAIHTNETVLDEAVIDAYDDLSRRLRDAIRGRQLP